MSNSLTTIPLDGCFAGGILDLTNNDLVVHAGSLTAVQALLAAGYDDGYWDDESNYPGIEPAAIGLN